MRTVKSGSFEEHISVSLKCVKYVVKDERNINFIYLNINQLEALNFIVSLFHASICFEHICSSSGGQNCTTQPLVSSHL